MTEIPATPRKKSGSHLIESDKDIVIARSVHNQWQSRHKTKTGINPNYHTSFGIL